MNYWTGTEWATSDSSFEIADDAFVAAKMQYKVRLSSELNVAGAVALKTRDNVVLNSTPVAIGLFDAQSGRSTIIGAVTNATGILVSSNLVVFQDAFSGIAADVVYTINKGSFEQDVVITGRLDVGAYGYPSNTTRVQIYTEFFNAPEPERVRRPIRVEENQEIRAAMATPDLVDTHLGFGEFVLPTGKAAIAYAATSSDAPSAPVVKEFTMIDGRTFLIESVEFASLYPTRTTAAIKGKAVNRTVAKLKIPTAARRKTSGIDSKPIRKMASLPKKEGSIIVDYVGTIGPGLSTPTVFQGDTTYLVTGTVTCNAVTMEGGAIFKYKYLSGTSTAYIQLNGTLTTTSSSHRPIIFTGVDDDSVGETMNGNTNANYSGSINTNGYANPALLFNSTTQTINDVRFRYCQEAVRVSSSFGNSISHAQLVSCIKGIVITGCGSGSGGAITVKNALFTSTTYPLTFSWSGIGASSFQHCTIDTTPRVVTDTVSGGGSFVNCIFANVTALSSGTPSLSGNNNGFYSSPTVGSSTTTSTANPFDSVKAGNYYLTQSSVFRNIGTTSIDSGLATDLKQRTVDAPIVLSGLNLSGTYSPAAARDTDTPDLGFHYDPIDFMCSGLSTTSDGSALLLTNGVIFGFWGSSGLAIPENGALIVQGTPINMSKFVWYPSSQEQPTLLDNVSTRSSALFDVSGATSAYASKPILQFRFTDFPMLGLRQDFFKGGSASSFNLQTLSFKDAWLRGVNCVINSSTNTFGTNTVPAASFVNNLFERSTVSVYNGYAVSGGVTNQNPITLTIYNGLFYRGDLTLTYKDAAAISHPTWTIRDNVFDIGSVGLSGDGSYSSYVTKSFDAFLSTTNASQLSGTGDVTLTTLTYSTGANGWRWYQSTRSPTLHDVDTGRTGADGGLYHFTTKTSEGKETTSNIDLGFHYIVLGTGNVPLDTDGDGIPDYLEDTNGNGTPDGSETDWSTTYNSPLGLSGTTGLQTFTPLR